jgi:hypothetical protein|tara:strand:+ start:8062 stop:8232 length:171 start_codon:yes stop_codon:yes gene_type:complete
MEEQKLISNIVLISFTCLWFIVLFTFGLLIYQSLGHADQIEQLLKSIEFLIKIEGT